MNCQSLEFSPRSSHERLKKARSLLGDKLLGRFLALALFLFGVKRSSIAAALELPVGTVHSLMTRFHHKGLPSLLDHRFKNPLAPLPSQATPLTLKPSLQISESELFISFGDGLAGIRIPSDNPLQARVLLLTFLSNGLLSKQDVSRALKLSSDRTGKLARQLIKEDIDAILDKRKGQLADYMFTPEVKGEVAQQFVVDLLTRGKTTGESLAQHLQQRCQLTLSPRTILFHLEKMGLNLIKNSLSALVVGGKKNSLS